MFAILAVLLAQVAAPTNPPRTPVITRPSWVQTPDALTVNAAFPEWAIRLNLDGRVKMQCQVLTSGHVHDCQILEETPAGVGFGNAALSVSRHFRLPPASADGASYAGASVRIPISFARAFEGTAKPPVRFDLAVGCVFWNKARSKIIPGNAAALESLARAKTYAEQAGVRSRKLDLEIRTAIARAETVGVEGWQEYGRQLLIPDKCQFA